MALHASLGFQFSPMLLPKQGVDLSKWAVIACDQFTSEPRYWDDVAASVGAAPSTYKMILPEVYLNTPLEQERTGSTRAAMRDYLAKGMFQEIDGPIYLERTAAGRTRKGLMLGLDLTRYEYTAGSQTLIRATEGTIVDRLPPRVRIREGAPLELPHIVVLIDDPDGTVIEPIAERKAALRKLYDFDLMLGGGHLVGYAAAAPEIRRGVEAALGALAQRSTFEQKYGVGADKGTLLFAVGDGNHSLATAKTIWERAKDRVGPDHPLRYALVEIENLHDPALIFEPIHRVLFGLRGDPVEALRSLAGGALEYRACSDEKEMMRAVAEQSGPGQLVGVIQPKGTGVATLTAPTSPLPVGTLERLLDRAKGTGLFEKIDYVHGAETVCSLGRQPSHAGLYLPTLAKTDLFRTVVLDGALPRKTFSMGHALEKRFYLECRKIE